jgi:hypothetical protein
MPSLACTVDIAHVQSGLSRAWRFLSGERRAFVFSSGLGVVPPLAEFSFFMPLTIAAQDGRGAVGVLIQRSDAIRVAAHMFGVPRDQVDDADLRDACAEVCNVFADCAAAHFGSEHDVKLGLPQYADAAAYAIIEKSSIPKGVYLGGTGAHSVSIVLYDSLTLPS